MSISYPVNIDTSYTDSNGNALILSDDVFCVYHYDSSVHGIEPAWDKDAPRSIDFVNNEFSTTVTGSGWYSNGAAELPFNFLYPRYAAWKNTDYLSGASIVTSSGYSGYNPENLVMLRTADGWRTKNSLPKANAVAFDLGSTTIVDTIWLKPSWGGVASNYLKDYRIGVSNSGYSGDHYFNIVASGTTEVFDNLPRIHHFTASGVRYVKLYADTGHGGSNIDVGMLSAFYDPNWSLWGIRDVSVSGTEIGDIAQDIDFTNIDKVYYDLHMYIALAYQNGTVSVAVDSDTIDSYSWSDIRYSLDSEDGSYYTKYENEVDVSAYTGEHTLHLKYTSNYGKNAFDVYFDNIKTYPGWCYEPVSSKRGSSPYFPLSTYLVSDGLGLSIIDATSLNLWMRFDIGRRKALQGPVRSVCALGGKVYCATPMGLVVINFNDNNIYRYADNGLYVRSSILNRNVGVNWHISDSVVTISSTNVFSVAAGYSSQLGKYYIALGTDRGLTILDVDTNARFFSKEIPPIRKVYINPDQPNRLMCIYGNEESTRLCYIDSIEEILLLSSGGKFSMKQVDLQSEDKLFRSSALTSTGSTTLRFHDGGLPFSVQAGVLTISGTKSSPGKTYLVNNFRAPMGSLSAAIDINISDWPDNVAGGLRFGLTSGWPEANKYYDDSQCGVFLSANNGTQATIIENDPFSGAAPSDQWVVHTDPFSNSSQVVVASGVLLARSKNSSPGFGIYGYYEGAVLGSKYLTKPWAAREDFTASTKVTKLITSADNDRPVATIFGISDGPFTGFGTGSSVAVMALYSEKATAASGVYCVGKLQSQNWTWDLTSAIAKDVYDGTLSASYRDWVIRYYPPTKTFRGYIDGNYCGSIDCSSFLGNSFGLIIGGVLYSPGTTDYVFTSYTDSVSHSISGSINQLDKEKYIVEYIDNSGFSRYPDVSGLYGKPFGGATTSGSWRTWEISYDCVNNLFRGSIDGTMVGCTSVDLGSSPTLALVYDMPYITDGDAFADLKFRNLVVSGTNLTVSGSVNSVMSEYGRHNAVEREALYVATTSGVDHLVFNRDYIKDGLVSLDNWTVRDAPSATNAPSSWEIDSATAKQSSAIYGSWNSSDYREPYGTHLVYTAESDVLNSRQSTFGVDVFNPSAAGAVGVVFCKQSITDDSNSFKNMYYYMLDFANGGKSTLGRVDSSTPIILATSSGSTLSSAIARNNIWHRVEIDSTGNEIVVKLDGVKDLSALDSTYTGGYVGLVSSNAANSRFKNFTVDSTNWRECYYRTSYGITGSNAEKKILWGAVGNVMHAEPSDSAVVASGVLYAATAHGLYGDYTPIFNRYGGVNATNYKCTLGCSYDGASLVLDYFPNTYKALLKRTSSEESTWEFVQSDAYGNQSGRLYRPMFAPDVSGERIYELTDDYFKFFSVSSGTLNSGLDTPPFSVLDSNTLEGTHLCTAFPSNKLLTCGEETTYPKVDMYDINRNKWIGVRQSLSDYSSSSKLHLVYSEVDDCAYILSDESFGSFSKAPVNCMSWSTTATDSEFPAKMKEFSSYAFYRPYDNSIYVLAYSGDVLNYSVLTKYDVKRGSWGFAPMGVPASGTQYYGGAYAPGADILFLISGNNNRAMYRYDFGGNKLPIERFWSPDALPENSTSCGFRKISWAGDSYIEDDTFTDSSKAFFWYDYKNHASDASIVEDSSGLSVSLTNTESNARIASRTNYIYFPPADLDISIKIKITSMPIPTNVAGYNYVRFGLTDYIGTRTTEDIRDTSLLGVNGLWMVAANEDDLTSRYTLWKRENKTNTRSSSTDYLDFWGNDGTSEAGFRTWRFVYTHSSKTLIAYVDGNLIGSTSFTGRGFSAGMYLSIYSESYGMLSAEITSLVVKDLVITSNTTASLVNGGYLLITDNNAPSGIYYKKMDSLLKKGPPYVFESQAYVSAALLTGTVYATTLFDIKDGTRRTLVCCLYIGGIRKIGIYTSGSFHLATAYTTAECDWASVKSYRLVITDSTSSVYVDDVLTVSESYLNMPEDKEMSVSFGSNSLKPERFYSMYDSGVSVYGSVSADTGSSLYEGLGKEISRGASNKINIVFPEHYTSTAVYVMYDASSARPTDVPFTVYHSGVVELPTADSYSTTPITAIYDNIDENGNTNANTTTVDISQTRLSDGSADGTIPPGVEVGSGLVYLGKYANPTSVVITGNHTLDAASSLSAIYIYDASYDSISRKTTSRIMYFRYGINLETMSATTPCHGALNVIDLEEKVLIDYYTKTTVPSIIGEDISSFDAHT